MPQHMCQYVASGLGHHKKILKFPAQSYDTYARATDSCVWFTPLTKRNFPDKIIANFVSASEAKIGKMRKKSLD